MVLSSEFYGLYREDTRFRIFEGVYPMTTVHQYCLINSEKADVKINLFPSLATFFRARVISQRGAFISNLCNYDARSILKYFALSFQLRLMQDQ